MGFLSSRKSRSPATPVPPIPLSGDRGDKFLQRPSSAPTSPVHSRRGSDRPEAEEWNGRSGSYDRTDSERCHRHRGSRHSNSYRDSRRSCCTRGDRGHDRNYNDDDIVEYITMDVPCFDPKCRSKGATFHSSRNPHQHQCSHNSGSSSNRTVFQESGCQPTSACQPTTTTTSTTAGDLQAPEAITTTTTYQTVTYPGMSAGQQAMMTPTMAGQSTQGGIMMSSTPMMMNSPLMMMNSSPMMMSSPPMTMNSPPLMMNSPPMMTSPTPMMVGQINQGGMMMSPPMQMMQGNGNFQMGGELLANGGAMHTLGGVPVVVPLRPREKQRALMM